MRNSITENEMEKIALSYPKNLGCFHIPGTDISPDGVHPERQYVTYPESNLRPEIPPVAHQSRSSRKQRYSPGLHSRAVCDRRKKYQRSGSTGI